MTDEYGTIIQRLKAVESQEPERFKQFYDRVWLILMALPCGAVLRIREHCKPASVDLFRDIAAITIIEQPFNKYGGMLEFSEDMDTLRRSADVRPRPKVFFGR